MKNHRAIVLRCWSLKRAKTSHRNASARLDAGLLCQTFFYQQAYYPKIYPHRRGWQAVSVWYVPFCLAFFYIKGVKGITVPKRRLPNFYITGEKRCNHTYTRIGDSTHLHYSIYCQSIPSILHTNTKKVTHFRSLFKTV